MKVSTAKRRFRRLCKFWYLALFRCSTMTSVDKPSEKYYSIGIHYK